MADWIDPLTESVRAKKQTKTANKPGVVSMQEYKSAQKPAMQKPAPKAAETKPNPAIQPPTNNADASASPAADLERWRKEWGEEYDEKEYKELDRIYENLSAEYVGVTSARILYNLRNVCVMELKKAQAIQKGSYDSAKKISDMIKTTLDLEGMKANDIKPLEAFQVAGMAQRLEQAGMMKDGVLLLDGVVNYIKNDYGKYNMCHDSVDACLMLILNKTRSNNGLSELAELEKDMLIHGRPGEFTDVATPREREAVIESGVQPNRHRIAERIDGQV